MSNAACLKPALLLAVGSLALSACASKAPKELPPDPNIGDPAMLTLLLLVVLLVRPDAVAKRGEFAVVVGDATTGPKLLLLLTFTFGLED